MLIVLNGIFFHLYIYILHRQRVDLEDRWRKREAQRRKL